MHELGLVKGLHKIDYFHISSLFTLVLPLILCKTKRGELGLEETWISSI